jgi:iron complex outermembrane receptor protein
VLLRNGGWTSRVSLGTGFFASTPLTEESEAAGLSRLNVPEPLRPERGTSASADLTKTAGHFTVTATFFASSVRDALAVERETAYALSNRNEAVTTAGVEGLATYRRAPFAVTATYAYVQSREREPEGLLQTPLTPCQSAGLVAMWEREGKGRVGLEFYYTGEQRLEASPYRTASAPYAIVGLLVERAFGRARLFLNAENLGDVRQTSWDPLVRPTQGADGRWTVDAWAPLDGRVINGGVRIAF